MATRVTPPECNAPVFFRPSGTTHHGMSLHSMHQPDLVESEALYRAMFEHAAIGLAHGTTRGYILRVNRAFASMLGYRPEELQGQNFADITHPHDAKLQMPMVRDLLGGHREKVEIEKRYIHRNGATVWAIVTMTVVRNPDGVEPYVIASIQDVSERKRAEEAILESEQRFRLVALA